MPATYEPIATTTLASAAASITFSAIANTWTDLRIVFVPKAPSSLAVGASIRFNGDTGANYSTTLLYGNGTAAASSRLTGLDYIGGLGIVQNGNIGMWTFDVMSYKASIYKTVLGETSTDENGSGTVGRIVGLWRNTAVVTSVTLYSLNNFQAGTTATLYGIARAA